MEDVSSLVARQYEAYAYPEPLTEIPGDALPEGDPAAYGPMLWPEGAPPRPSILIAGCGTNQAAIYARNNPLSQVVGVDLSEASLAHERFLQDRHELSNLKLMRGDLRDAAKLGAFDLIVSTGVLHHMADPDEGLKALAAALKPSGALLAMVYGQTFRLGVYLLQDAFRRMGLKQDEAGIELVKATLAQLHPSHIAKPYIDHAADLASEAGLVDTFLHPQDRAYTVPQLLEWVKGAGLELQGWVDNELYYPAGTLKGRVRAHVETLPVEQQWAVVEDLTGGLGTHSFIARRRAVPVEFGLAARPLRRPGLETLGQGRFAREGLTFELSVPEAFLLEQCDGRTIGELLQAPQFQGHPPEARESFGRAFFDLMWRRGHVMVWAAKTDS
jgi:SAM-dependent methyltransferase